MARAAPLIAAANLPPALQLHLESMLAPGQDGWVVMAPLDGVADPAAVAAAIRAAHLPNAAFVDLNAESAGLLGRFQREAVTLAVTGSIAILILLLAGLRSARRAIAVAAPLAAAAVLTLALLTWSSAFC
jgi:predicted exporter